MNSPFELSKEEMKTYGYKIIDLIVKHYDTIDSKKPVTSASRAEMDHLFLQEAPNESMPAGKVLDSAGVIALAAHVEAGVFRVNPQSISINHTIDSADNAMSAGPISIDSGVTITINGNWSVV